MKKALGFLLGCCITAFAFGQWSPPDTEPPADYKGDTVLAVHVSAVVGPPNNQRWIEISTGPLATKGVRVYSEPSHTLIAGIVDLAYSETVEGKAWLASFAGDKKIGSISYTQLPLGRSAYQVPDFPVTDTFIRTFVNGDFFGNEGDVLIGGQFMGTSHTFSGSNYFPKLSKNEFDAMVVESSRNIHTASVERSGSCDHPPLTNFCCDRAGCGGDPPCILVNIWALPNCCYTSDGCNGPYCPSQICRNAPAKGPSAISPR